MSKEAINLKKDDKNQRIEQKKTRTYPKYRQNRKGAACNFLQRL